MFNNLRPRPRPPRLRPPHRPRGLCPRPHRPQLRLRALRRRLPLRAVLSCASWLWELLFRVNQTAFTTCIQQCHALTARAQFGFVLTRCSVLLLYNLLFLSVIVVVASAGSSGFVAFGNVPVETERKAH